jgi:hypothetical protein
MGMARIYGNIGPDIPERWSKIVKVKKINEDSPKGTFLKPQTSIYVLPGPPPSKGPF